MNCIRREKQTAGEESWQFELREINDEVHHNDNLSWTIGSIFIVAAFTVLGGSTVLFFRDIKSFPTGAQLLGLALTSFVGILLMTFWDLTHNRLNSLSKIVFERAYAVEKTHRILNHRLVHIVDNFATHRQSICDAKTLTETADITSDAGQKLNDYILDEDDLRNIQEAWSKLRQPQPPISRVRQNLYWAYVGLWAALLCIVALCYLWHLTRPVLSIVRLMAISYLAGCIAILLGGSVCAGAFLLRKFLSANDRRRKENDASL